MSRKLVGVFGLLSGKKTREIAGHCDLGYWKRNKKANWKRAETRSEVQLVIILRLNGRLRSTVRVMKRVPGNVPTIQCWGRAK